jgi:hypothetical protein
MRAAVREEVIAVAQRLFSEQGFDEVRDLRWTRTSGGGTG